MTSEQILAALKAMLEADAGFGWGEVLLDQGEPSGWNAVVDAEHALFQACAVQGPGAPDLLATVSGAEGFDAEELQLEAIVAYAVYGSPAAGQREADIQPARRARREAAAKRLAVLIRQDRTLGLGPQVYAELAPATREDEARFRDAPPAALVLIPVRVLFAAEDPSD